MRNQLIQRIFRKNNFMITANLLKHRHKYLFILLSFLLWIPVYGASQQAEISRWERQAKNVSIVRDDWGIAHVTGKTDADAVFGMIYAQAEDDFNRVETNYLNSMGRLAEAEGESAIWSDLRQKLFIQPEFLKKKYAESPAWLQKLMNAWADGLNFYLAKHPEVKPRVITKFEPWMALSFTEGSIGGDIESINLRRLQEFYGANSKAAAVGQTEQPWYMKEPTGSNGIAIAPKNTVDGKALLLINPHTSFFFRSELQMTSGEGLNVYGAATWGQFFIYQGFNERLGFMHTSSTADAIDEWRETIVKKGDKYFYKFGAEERPITTEIIKVPYKTAGGITEKTFTVYRTHHGPVIRKDDAGNWITVGLMNEPVKALTQSFSRTKAKNIQEFREVMKLQANSSNNTLYADADGNIALFYVNFIPRRNPKFDWTKPVDGSDPESDWKGLLTFEESPNVINPASGWVYNSNNSPWSAAGASSLKQADYPKYIDKGIESARGRHAIMVLQNRKDFTLDKLREAAYDSYLPWFEKTVPALVAAWDKLAENDALKAKLKDQIEVLRPWNFRWETDSVPTSLAVFWGGEILRAVGPSPGVPTEENVLAKATPAQMLEALTRASDKLTADFGKWQTPWGEINRFQRLTGDIVHPFNDAAPSIPVGFTSGNWGSLASFGAAPTRSTKKWYGTSGNSFVAVVEFGKRIRAKAVTAGGESGNPKSPHFNDQALRYATGDLREVYFYPDQLKGHTEKKYIPGN
jgi:acyl-homoserine-lactone acylase